MEVGVDAGVRGDGEVHLIPCKYMYACTRQQSEPNLGHDHEFLARKTQCLDRVSQYHLRKAVRVRL